MKPVLTLFFGASLAVISAMMCWNNTNEIAALSVLGAGAVFMYGSLIMVARS